MRTRRGVVGVTDSRLAIMASGGWYASFFVALIRYLFSLLCFDTPRPLSFPRGQD